MFQVAFARSLSLANNEDVYIDKSAYKSYKIRSFSVDNLSCIENVKLVEDCDFGYFTKLYVKTTQKTYRIYQKIFKIVTNDLKIGFNSFFYLSKLGLYYNFDPYFYKLENKKNKKNKKKYLYGYFFKDCSLVIDIRLLLKLFNLIYRRSRYSKTKNYAFS
jgi:hypothetical protein